MQTSSNFLRKIDKNFTQVTVQDLVNNPHMVIFQKATPVVKDHRGWFRDWGRPIVADGLLEIKHSDSGRDVVRGMHQQPQAPQIKELMVINGNITDLIYDPDHQILYKIKMSPGDRVAIGPALFHGFISGGARLSNEVMYHIHLNPWMPQYEVNAPLPLAQLNDKAITDKIPNVMTSRWVKKYIISAKDTIGNLDITNLVVVK